MTMTVRKGWAGTDLGPYRQCDGTYCFFEEQSLPPLPAFDGSFSWLPTGPRQSVPSVEHRSGGTEVVRDPDLPPSYLAFFSRPELSAAIPSCTACYWSPGAPVPSPLGDGGRLVRFLSDQQDVLHWFLELPAEGGHRVLCGSFPYGEAEATAAHAARDLVEVAPSFEAFVYRFWVENLAWFELDAGRELTPAVRAYLSGYSQPAAE